MKRTTDGKRAHQYESIIAFKSEKPYTNRYLYAVDDTPGIFRRIGMDDEIPGSLIVFFDGSLCRMVRDASILAELTEGGYAVDDQDDGVLASECFSFDDETDRSELLSDNDGITKTTADAAHEVDQDMKEAREAITTTIESYAESVSETDTADIPMFQNSTIVDASLEEVGEVLADSFDEFLNSTISIPIGNIPEGKDESKSAKAK